MYWGTNSIEKVYLGTTEVGKIYLGTTEIYDGSGSGYEQKWSDDQPSQHNTPVPLDEVGLSTGVVSASVTKSFESYTANEAIGLTTGLVSATVTQGE